MSSRGKSKTAASRASKKSRSVRAGLQFSVGRIHRIIRHVGDLKQEVNNPGEQNPETHLTPAEIAAVEAQALTKVKEENFKHIASGLDVNQPTLPHGLGSIFVTPPNILKRQLTGYCTSPGSSPMGRDNKNGWYEELSQVSQGNVVDLVKDRKRSRSKSGSTTPPPKTQQKQNRQTTSMTFTTTVLPKPKPTATLPPPTAIAPKLKIPPTVTSTLIPTIPPTTTSPLIMTTQPTATLPLTPIIPPTATLTLILTIPPTATLPHMQLTLPPRALTTTFPPTTTIPPSLRPTTIPTPKHLPKCNRPINTPTRPTTVSPKPNPLARTLTTTTNFLSLSILLLLPFILLCLINNVAFNVELRDCKQSFLYHGRNLYITNVFHYTRLKFKVFNNNVSNTNHSLPISGIAYTLDDDFPSKNFTHKIHYKSGPEAHTIKLVFFPLLFLFMVTISNWIRKETFSYYRSIKHKYLFLKSRRHFRKHGTLFIFQKVLLFLLVVLTFDAKLPSRTQNDLITAIVKDNELFTIQYITTADVIRSNHIKNQSSLYALTKLKFSKHHSYSKYLLILSGDINLHPGPVKYPCSVCAKPVRKRIIS